MSVQSKIKVIFGTAPFGRNSVDKNQEYLNLLARYKVVDLDTAFSYVGSPHMSIHSKTNKTDAECFCLRFNRLAARKR